MGDALIKGIGKRILVSDNKVLINKTIGKNIEIEIDFIRDIRFVKGTMSKNGSILITWQNENGQEKSEEIFFTCTYNDIAEALTLGLTNYINGTDEVLTIANKGKVGTFKQLNIEAKEASQKSIQEKREEKYRLQELDKQKIPYCPKCHSTSLTTTDKKLSVSRALVGGTIAGGAGAVLGGLSSKKVLLVCMNCGYKWKPGK